MNLGGLGLSGLVVSFVSSTTLTLESHRPSSAAETLGNSERPSHDRESNPVSLDSGNPLPSTEGGVGVTRSESPRSIMAGGRQIVYVDDAITVSGIPASRTKSVSSGDERNPIRCSRRSCNPSGASEVHGEPRKQVSLRFYQEEKPS